MLTKDLVKFRVRKGAVHPALIKPADLDKLNAAEDLVTLFREGVGLSRGELAQRAQELIDIVPFDALIARGFEKLLLDRTDFQTPEDEVMPQLRDQVFTTGSQVLRAGDYDSYEGYLAALKAELDQDPNQLAGRLYADLPEHHPMLKFRDISPSALIHRYNAAQIQWLLMQSDKLIIKLKKDNSGSLRQLFKYLRFHQLLTTIELSDDCYVLNVDGPLNLFHQSKKYGLNLARFFPALLHQKRWSLSAVCALRGGKQFLLELDHSKGIKPWSHHFLNYIPAEYDAFRDAVAQKIADWDVVQAGDFIALPGERICFPDFQLNHKDGTAVAVELFHSWHRGDLPTRLETLDQQDQAPLLIGVAARLLKDEETKAALEASPYFNKWGFKFRDLPTVTSLRPLLRKQLDLA